MHRPTFVACLAALAAAASAQMPLSTPLPALQVVPDGVIKRCAFGDGRLYVAGDFTTIGVETGGFALLDPEFGDPLPGLPPTNGDVRAVASDGAGGWYFGGDFNLVGESPRSNIAHVNADGELTDWAPSVNGEVFCLAVDDTAVFVGGFYGSISGQPRSNLASVNRATGNPTLFDPDADGVVIDIALADGALYAAGGFSMMGGQARAGLASVETFLGGVQPFNPVTSGSLTAMAIDGDDMYIAGLLGVDGAPASRHVLSIDLTTGLPDGIVDVSYSFGAFGSVRDIAVAPDRIYVGGCFDQLGPSARDLAGAIDRTSGLVVIWAPTFDQPDHFANEPDIYALAVRDDVVYVMGDFHVANDEPRVCMAAFSTSFAQLLPFNVTPGGQREAWAVATSDDVVAVGGRFSILGQPAPGLAVYDPSTGERIPWITAWPDEDAIDHNNLAVAWHDGLVYVGGVDDHVSRVTRYTYALDDVTGEIVHDLSVVDDKFRQRGHNADGNQKFVFIDGMLVTALDGYFADPTIIAGFDVASGDVLWEMEYTGAVACLAASPTPGQVLVGGMIESIGGVAPAEAQGLASIDATTGEPLFWDLPVNGDVLAMQVVGDDVHLAGEFTMIGPVIRDRLAAVSLERPDQPALTSWEPDPDGDVSTLLLVGETLVAGGDFTTIGGGLHPRLGALTIDNGFACSWDPEPSDAPAAIATDGSLLAVALPADAAIGGEPRPHLAVFATGLCDADFNGDCMLNILDFVAYQNAFVAGDAKADCDASGALNILDFVCFQNAFSSGCP